MDEHERKIRELFGDELKNDDIYYKRAEDGNLVVAQDEDGNDIKMNSNNIVSNDDPRLRRFGNGVKFGNKSMEEMLQLDPNIVKELTSKEHKEELKKKEERKRLDKFKRRLEEEGVDPESMVAKRRIEIYEKTKDFIKFPRELEAVFNDNEIEEYADDLSMADKEEIRRAKRNGLMMSPEMLLGSKRTNDLISMTSQTKTNDFYWMDFIKFCSTQHNIDITTIDGSREFIDSLWDSYMKWRRPPLHLLIEKTISELEENALADMRADENRNDEFIRSYRDDEEVRKQVVAELHPYSMDDFKIFLFYFRQFGRHAEDSEYFDPNYPVAKGVRMSYYLNKFKERTGFEFLDVYYHYYKLSEEIDFKMTGKADDKNEVYGMESLDEVSIKGKDNIKDDKEESIEAFMDGVDFD